MTTTPTALPSRTVSLTYYAAGKQLIVSFDTSSPEFRTTIRTLNEQHRPFRIVYH